ncbi:methyltransferase domain-containing protein [Parachryseolinea silvisoli]|jgi:2-polyprenyl-3-methyl-5-hydroxy-6-metoxy-1,4-benzoquinol methylase|uniref:methyltransferase domain-containing protein n=1 Tax=Parachryseolinea silvisoli TaxID=2873601 RepID=UPI00226590F9|nr:methyltransferase domain-containing protein [Parachryseolinea silvisoli]MCD9016367.1 methyltransferase domain-containing protein [Parachryseolinea silvisoli]
MPNFSARSTEIEIMDDLLCAGEVVHQTLRELEFINKWLGGNAVTITALERLLKDCPTTGTITIVDLGCGGGEMLRIVHQWAAKKAIPVKLIGIDANPHIIAFAEQNLQNLPEIEFLSLDIFSKEFKNLRFDVVLGTLFYHHFNDDQLTAFFKNLRDQATKGIIINDIHRHPLAYYSIKWLTTLFSRSPMVKFDAPLSVLRAFKKKEMARILKNAGIQDFHLQWKWAFRWRVIINLRK